ncbi:MAG: PAS domain S-box protein, partial [Deltaproteobacteria bacterium]|nr:PAS domain S-box protein [Deltaproteobacteria bacterium]
MNFSSTADVKEPLKRKNTTPKDGSISILYVDDEPVLLEIGKKFLEKNGLFHVDIVTSVTEALERIKIINYDAILSDYQMPDMSGIDFLKAIRSSGNSLPFILFTGRGQEEIVIEALNEGADFYVQRGSDPRTQFIELSDKISFAVRQWKYENSIRNLGRREVDIINFLPDPTFAIDNMGKVIAWNHAIEVMTGIPASDMLGKGNYDYSLPFYNERRPMLIDLILKPRKKIEKYYKNFTFDKNIVTADIEISFRDDVQMTFMSIAAPLYDGEGKIIGAIESLRDISQRKHLEEAVVKSEKRFRDMTNLLPQGVFECDLTGILTFVNQKALNMWGYDLDDFNKGIHTYETVILEERPRIIEKSEKILNLRDLTIDKYDYHGLRKDGSIFPVSISLTPILESGKTTGLRGVLVDMTDHQEKIDKLRSAYKHIIEVESTLRKQYEKLKKDEELIRQSEARFHNMAELLPQVVFETDTFGNLTYTNEIGFKSFGYTRKDFESRKKSGRRLFVMDGIVPEDRERCMKAFMNAQKTDAKPHQDEYRVLRKDGTSFPAIISSSPIIVKGEIKGVRGLVIDMTEQRSIIEKLTTANKELAEAKDEIDKQYEKLKKDEELIRQSE